MPWRRLAPAAAVGLMCTLVGCYSDDSASGQDARATATATPAVTEFYPGGVLTTGDAKGEILGIYPASGSDVRSCCWLGPQAVFRVGADAAARTLKLTIYEPAIPRLSDSQRVSLVDAAGRVLSSYRVVPGKQTFGLPIPKNSVDNGAVSVRLRMATSIVPKDAGLNDDIRRISVILQDVSAQ